MSKRRLKGEGTISKVKRGDKEYWRLMVTVGYDDEGKQIRKAFYGKTQKEANNKYAEWKNKQSFNSDDKNTFADTYKNWLFEFKKIELKASTFEKYYGIYKNYILSNNKLANTKLTDLSTMQLQKYYNSLIADGKPLSTVKNTNRYIKTFLQDCVKQGLILRNPCDNVKFSKEIIVDKEEQFIFLTEEEQKKLVQTLRGDDLELLILMALCCGMRLGEILALEYKDFDFEECWININKSIKRLADITPDGKRTYKMTITTPKTINSIRKAPLPSFLIPKVKQLHKLNLENKLKYGEMYCNSGLLFCKKDGTPLDSKLPNRRLKAVLKKAGLDKDLHFHDLRHLFISNCIDKDIAPKTVASWVGHSDISITLNIYAKISKEKLQESSKLVNSIFESMF